MENEPQIEQQTSNTNRLITITNWNKYQIHAQQSEQRPSNERATSEQRVSTNKNVKNVKNVKKSSAVSLTDNGFLSKLRETYPWVDMDFQIKKMEGWLLVNPGRKMTRKFMVNWLNKIDKPINTKKEEDDYDI